MVVPESVSVAVAGPVVLVSEPLTVASVVAVSLVPVIDPPSVGAEVASVAEACDGLLVVALGSTVPLPSVSLPEAPSVPVLSLESGVQAEIAATQHPMLKSRVMVWLVFMAILGPGCRAKVRPGVRCQD
jgi:hypothetical protein